MHDSTVGARPTPPAAAAETPTRPITPVECAEEAAATLRIARETAANGTYLNGDAAARSNALAHVAAKWVELGITLDQHPAMRRRPAEDNER